MEIAMYVVIPILLVTWYQVPIMNCPVDPGSIQGSHWPISLTRNYIPVKNTRERLIINLEIQSKWERRHITQLANYQHIILSITHS